ncbi:MAG: zinc ribbon domain-containing protein [Nocardioidaceae bacterium]|nr:zinc ribbon domain-containing protein [Nocardioidaceae bacterium]
MRIFADPSRCPDCGASIAERPTSCPACGLPLGGPVAASLFATLQSADRLLAELRSQQVIAPLPVTPPAGAEAGVAIPPITAPGLPPYVAPARPARAAGTGLSGASVPKILLTLGALCLLVAAVTFLAVAWAWLGVGGRTAVLVALTALAAGATWWSHRTRLRAAAESLGTVALGLLALDVTGADNAGWFGTLAPGALPLIVGLVVAVAAAGAALLSSRGQPTLVAPQVVVGLAGWVAVAGLVEVTDHISTSSAVGVAVLLLVALVTHRAGLAVLPWTAGAAAVLWWLPLLGNGLVRLTDDPSLRGLWVEGLAWPVVAAALLLAAPLVVAHRRPWAPVLLGGGPALLLTIIALAPLAEEPATAVLAGTLVALTIWALAALVGPARWRPVGLVALLPAFPIAAVLLLQIVADALERVTGVGDPWTAGAGVRLPASSYDVQPLLLPVGTMVLLLVAAAAGRGLGLRPEPRPTRVVAGTLVLVAVVATVASYAVPLWLVMACVLLGALSLGMVSVSGLLDRDDVPALAAVGMVGLALATALASDVLTAVVLAVATLLAVGWWALGRSDLVPDIGRVLTPVAGGALIWTVAELAGLEPEWRAIPVLIGLGLLAVLTAQVPVEGGAAATALAAGLASAAAGFLVSDSRGWWALAIVLTLAGAAQVVSSLVNQHRRELAWSGGLMLAMATWVRLYDAGVTTPEAYTLPSALVLVAVGLVAVLRRGLPTMTALTPGLSLATVPTLLQVLGGDPVSWRAFLLGAAALALVLVGTRLHWGGPLVVGAVIGALLVIREAGPYAAALPPWLLIAVAGTVLTVVGITWERGLRDLRRGAAYLARLH